MKGVSVLTVAKAASDLDIRRERVAVMLAAGELTRASINGRDAVLVDLRWHRAKGKTTRAAA